MTDQKVPGIGQVGDPTSGQGGDATADRYDYDVSDHTVEDVESWVGDDQAKASYALEQEKDGKNRKTLVERLGEIVAG